MIIRISTYDFFAAELASADRSPIYMNEHLNELWELIYNELPKFVNLPDSSIRLWFDSIRLRYMSENRLYMSIDNFLKRKFILEHYMDGFCAAIKAVLGFEPDPILICTEKDSFENQFADIVSQNSEEFKNVDFDFRPAVKEEPKKQEIPEYDRSSLPPERTVYTDSYDSTAPNTLDKAVHRGLSVPKRYNSKNGTFEEVKLSDYIDDKNDGMLMMSPSAPNCYPSYTFENFIVGNSNRFAYQYALQASHYPAQQYNPLYIYGSPGLGKTHLLYAITNEIMRLHPTFNIIYVKGEDFTNELVEALQKKTPLQFREKYRNADVLLMDDVQFIAGRDSTQEEFFHTYNALYETGKQIIMTSDKAPKDIKDLEERLRSRFEHGPLVKIDAPDIELRTAIIKKKFELMKIDIPNEVVMYLSENLKDNIRQIEGVIKKMNAYCLMCGEKITMSLAEKSISDIVTITSKIDGTKIVNAAAEKYGIAADEILGKKRTKEIAWPRHMSVYVMRKLTDMSLNDIGKFFNRDHSTIITSIEKIEKESEENSSVAKEIQDLIDIVKLKA